MFQKLLNRLPSENLDTLFDKLVPSSYIKMIHVTKTYGVCVEKMVIFFYSM